jgi:hypothetical protein
LRPVGLLSTSRIAATSPRTREELLRFRESTTAELRIRQVDDATFDRLTQPRKRKLARATSSLPALRT